METGFMNRITGLVIALVVGGLLVGGLLIPTIQGMTETEKTYTNTGLWRMSAFDDNQEWEYENSTWTLNGVEQISGGVVTNNGASSAITGDNWLIRANGWIRGNTMSGNSTNPVTVATANAVTVTDGNNTVTMNHSGYGVDTNGNYLMTAYNSTVYVKGDSQIYATGQSNWGTARGIIHLEGTINDGITGYAYAIKNDAYTDFTIDNITVNYEAVDGYENLYKLSGITADVSCKDTDNAVISGSVSYSSYVVPYQVTAELSQHLDATQIAMFGVISILGIVALVVLAANGIRNKY